MTTIDLSDMTNAPFGRGRKDGEAGELFTSPQENPLVEPDRVSPTVASYFRIPPIWVGEQPDPATVLSLNPAVHHRTVLEKALHCGIKVRVQQDGLFSFDFSDFRPAAHTIIPGFVRPAEGPYRRPRDHAEAENQAELVAVFRAQIMNAHQACLTSAQMKVGRSAGTMGYPVTAWSTYKSINLAATPPYRDDVEDPDAVARNIYNNSYALPLQTPHARSVLSTEVVEESFRMLDVVLRHEEAGAVAILEANYIAAIRSVEKRFGESVVLGWTACEQLISLAWSRLLDSIRNGEIADRMPRKRAEKLNSRDYTASVKVEILELHGVLDHTLYNHLEIARRARNKWAHSMDAPSEIDVHNCLEGARLLMFKLLGLDIFFQSGGRGSVPQWPVWMLDRPAD